MLPKREKEERYLLLGSVFAIAGLLSVFVDAERLRDGIMEVFMYFTLAARAKDAWVGVVAALGRPERGRDFAGVAVAFSKSDSVSRDTGRAAEVSSPYLCFTRLPEVFSSVSLDSPRLAKDLKDLVLPSGLSG